MAGAEFIKQVAKDVERSRATVEVSSEPAPALQPDLSNEEFPDIPEFLRR